MLLMQSNRVKRRKIRTGKEFRLYAQIDGYEIKDVMLDLGFYFNILPNQSWEALGKPRLVYSPLLLYSPLLQLRRAGGKLDDAVWRNNG